MNFPIPGVWADHFTHDTELLNEEPALAKAFTDSRRVRAGFGYRIHLDLTLQEARQLADHIEGIYELEMQIAGGAGSDANYSLIRSGPGAAKQLRR